MIRIALAALFMVVASVAFAKAPPGPLPDLSLTPGVFDPSLTVAKICHTKWGKDERHVTEAMKLQAFHEYGYDKANKDTRCPCEVDHLVSRELGGMDVVKNLWIQPYKGPWNAHMKDRVENKLHVEVCAGRLPLKDAQKGIVKDWTVLYTHYFGKPED